MNAEQKRETRTKFSDEEREAILEEMRSNLESARAGPSHDGVGFETSSRDEVDDAAVRGEAMREPTETLNQRHARELLERDEQWARERRQREREAQARAREAEPDWSAVDTRIASAAAGEREFVFAVLEELIPEIRDRQAKALAAAVAPMKTEMAQLKAQIADMRNSAAADIERAAAQLNAEIVQARAAIAALNLVLAAKTTGDAAITLGNEIVAAAKRSMN
jgi:hypothetical protein